jgi:hypothetical protein
VVFRLLQPSALRVETEAATSGSATHCKR